MLLQDNQQYFFIYINTHIQTVEIISYAVTGMVTK